MEIEHVAICISQTSLKQLCFHQAVRECVSVGASLLLPSLDERVELLLSFLSAEAGQCKQLSIGQVSEILLSLYKVVSMVTAACK